MSTLLQMMNFFSPLALLIILCAAKTPASSQSASSQSASSGVSLAALLQLQSSQSERLELLFQRAAPRLGRDGEVGPQKISAERSAARARALQVLSPVQRAQLDSLAGDSRFRVRRDNLYQLLLSPLTAWQSAPDVFPQKIKAGANIAGANIDAPARRNWLDARRLAGETDLRRAQGVGSYGVYGGYNYGGPQLGVYGGYQQGAVGVRAGIGLGGPSVGISVGRVFGIGRR